MREQCCVHGLDRAISSTTFTTVTVICGKRFKRRQLRQEPPPLLWSSSSLQLAPTSTTALPPMNCFAELEQMKQIALVCARKILGEAGGKTEMHSLISHKSKEYRKLKAQMTRLTVVRREIHARRNTEPRPALQPAGFQLFMVASHKTT